MSPRPITITSYNMHKGMSALNRKVQVDSMAEELRGIGSDVLFLQEVQGQHLTRSSRLPDFPEKPHYDILGDRLSYNRSYGKNAVYPQRHEVFVDSNGKRPKTFPARLPVLSLDRVYTRNLEVLDSQIHNGKNWQRLSDHLPLSVKVRPKLP